MPEYFELVLQVFWIDHCLHKRGFDLLDRCDRLWTSFLLYLAENLLYRALTWQSWRGTDVQFWWWRYLRRWAQWDNLTQVRVELWPKVANILLLFLFSAHNSFISKDLTDTFWPRIPASFDRHDCTFRLFVHKPYLSCGLVGGVGPWLLVENYTMLFKAVLNNEVIPGRLKHLLS